MGKAISLTLGGIQFAKKGDARAYLQAMLNRYMPGQKVSDADSMVLHDALEHHPDAASKIGVGIDCFVVRSAEFNTQCFWVTRIDGTTERFSYKSCV